MVTLVIVLFLAAVGSAMLYEHRKRQRQYKEFLDRLLLLIKEENQRKQ